MKKIPYTLFSILLIILTLVTWEYVDTRDNNYSLFAFSFLFVCWLLIRSQNKNIFLVPKITLPLTIYIGLLLILLTITPLQVYGIDLVTRTLVSTLFIIFVVDSINLGWSKRIWEDALIILAILFVLIDLVSVFFKYANWWYTLEFSSLIPPYSIRTSGGLFFHPNLMAGFINLIIPFIIFRIIRTEKIFSKWLWLSFLVLSLIDVFFTSSRGGWIAMVGGLLIMLFLVYAPSFKSMITHSQFASYTKFLKNRTLWITASLLVPICIALIPIIYRQVSKAPHGSAAGRFDIWNYAIKLFNQSPIWGMGPGSTPFYYALRSNAIGIGTHEAYHTHNLWLQIIAETGIIGLIISFWALTLIIRLCIKSWKNSIPKSPDHDILIIFIVVCISLGLHNLVDFLFANLLITLSFFIILSLLYINGNKQEYFIINKYKTILSMIPILALLVGTTLYSRSGLSLFTSGVKSAHENDWNTAQDYICHAARENPSFSYFTFQCSFARSMVAIEDNTQESLYEIISLQKKALKLDPYWYVHWANLASYEWRNGDQNQAINHMTKASYAAPNKAFLWFNLAYMEEKVGWKDLSVIHYRRALCLEPFYQESLVFNESSLQKNVEYSDCTINYSAVQNNKQNQLLWKAWKAIHNEKLELAEQLLSEVNSINSLNSLAFALAAFVNHKSGNHVDEHKDIETALFINRTSLMTLLVAAQLAQDDGQFEQELDYLSEAFDIYQHPKYSSTYYFYAYHSFNLPLDISPFLITPISLDTCNAFLRLAEFEHQNGNLIRADRILNWISVQINENIYTSDQFLSEEMCSQ